MTILNVPDMHCSKCVERITNALNAAGLKFTAVSYTHLTLPTIRLV